MIIEDHDRWRKWQVKIISPTERDRISGDEVHAMLRPFWVVVFMRRLLGIIEIIFAMTIFASCVTGGDYTLIPDDHSKGSPLSIVGTYPGDGDVDISVNTDVRVAFSAKLNLTTVTNTSLQLASTNGDAVAGAVSIGSNLDTLIFTPTNALAYSTSYRASVASTIADVNGNFPESESTITFTTAAEPDPPTPPVPVIPQVTFVTPNDGATDVAINVAVDAVFNTDMDSATFSTGTFQMSSGGVPVGGSVVYTSATKTARFTPNIPLRVKTLYTITITQGVTDLKGTPLVAQFTTSFTTIDAASPIVLSVTPNDGAVDVPITAVVDVVFSKAMDPATINTSTMTVTVGGAPVAGTVAYNGGTQTARFTPNASLSSHTVYAVTVSSLVQDTDGKHLNADFNASFTTVDVTIPAVLSTTPSDGATNVPLTTGIDVVFNKAMDASTITTTTFTVATGGVPVVGIVSYNAGTQTARFTPNANLTDNTLYAVTVTQAVTDTDGRHLASDVNVSFTTVSIATPLVLASNPRDGATNVLITTPVDLVFNKAMDASTITTATFTVSTGGAPIAGSVSYNAGTQTARFTPNANLNYNTLYAVSLAQTVTDMEGKHLAADYHASFTTYAIGTPVVLAMTPSDGSTTAPIQTVIDVVFSKTMDASTITTATFTVSTGGAPIAGSVSYDVGTQTAHFTPNANLTYNTAYAVVISQTVVDTDGIHLSADYHASFTTVNVASPTVLAVTPSDGSTQIPITTVVDVVFSKAMDPASITTTSFTVATGGAPIGSTVAYTAATQTARLTPNASLLNNTVYTVTMAQSVVDTDGKHLAADFTSTFTTKALILPTVLAVTPSDGSTDIPVDTVIDLIFNKAMDAGTITTSSVIVKQGGVPIAGSVTYLAGSQTARFVPDADLDSQTLYTISATTDIADTEGIHLAALYSTSFTTADVVAPTVLSTSPLDGSGNVGVNSAVEVRFDKSMDVATITTLTFTVTPGGAPIAGNISYISSTNTAVFTPAVNLASFTTYTATMAGSVTDRSGNALGSDDVFSFTTSDVTAPTVTGTTPLPGATGVARNTVITATFSKAMNGATIDGSSFTVGSSFGATAGAVTYDAPSKTATLTPSSSLFGSTVYTVTLTTAIQDSVGNALAGTYSFTFTTAAAPPVASASGLHHSVAVLDDGTVLTWGRNQYGQLGDGTRTDRAAPVRVPGLTGVIAVAAGEFHTLALKSNGTMWSWGRNNFGQLGDNTIADRTSPVQTIGPGNVTAIATGLDHNLALRSDGTVYSWGLNGNGQLGDGTNTNAVAPQPIGGLTTVTKVAAGWYHSLAIKSAGTAWAWGLNGNGQLGIGSTTSQPYPVQMSTLANVAAIAGGGYHTVARLTAGTAWACGLNANGQLGDNTTTQRTTVVQVHGIGNVGMIASVRDVAAGGNFTMLARNDGSLVTFGLNTMGQLGDGTVTQRLTPVLIAAAGTTTAIAAGGYHSLVLRNDATLASWGYNYYGQVGNSSATFVGYTPYQVSGLGTITGVGGGATHTIVVASDATAWGWGVNANGQLGDNTTTSRTTPVQVHGVSDVGMLTSVAAVAAGSSHSLARKTDNTAFAWGNNTNGQLGDVSTTQRLTPVQVRAISGGGNLTNVADIACGDTHSLARLTTGTLVSWGNNANGQLGDGSTTQRTRPVAVSGLTNITAIAGGNSHSLALRSDGTVWAWGNNASGQVGDATTTQRTSAVQVHGPGNVGMLSNIVAIDAGNNYSMAVSSSGAVYTWGSNTNGQLGDGSFNSKVTPVQVRGPLGVDFLTNVVAVKGYDTTLALTGTGTVYSWGYNIYGEIGAMTTYDQVVPVQVLGTGGAGFLSSVTALSRGSTTSLALTSGHVMQWGWNTLNPLLDTTNSFISSPVAIAVP